MRETVKVLFASCSEAVMPGAIQHMREIFPELPLLVVSEFPPGHERWIRFPVARGFFDNLALVRWYFRDKHVRLSAVILEPRMPYRRMRLIGFLLSPWNFLAMNENFGHFMLRPRSAGTMLRHFLWRARNFFVWQFSPGGPIYTFLWRLVHPRAFRRPLAVLLARAAGLIMAARKAIAPARPAESSGWNSRPRGRFKGAAGAQSAAEDTSLLPGITVVIPSRNGKDLLARLLPSAAAQIGKMAGEIIVVDNGSDDGTAEFLRGSFPQIAMEQSAAPLSFARAVNAGIRKARYSHVCMLNNDMVLEAGFFSALAAAFEQVPDLFCATAQIFFPAGERREETGKAVMPFPSDRKRTDYPVRCDLPVPGEDLSYVLYGSGGCSLYDAGKLHALGGLDEAYEPAYVEDLDLGFRAWGRGWPSVFVAGARVEHRHRATTSRYFSREYLDQVLEMNYLRFLARAVGDARVFRRLWQEAIQRLNLLAVAQNGDRAAAGALGVAWRGPWWMARGSQPVIDDSEILAIGSGAVVVARGTALQPRERSHECERGTHECVRHKHSDSTSRSDPESHSGAHPLSESSPASPSGSSPSNDKGRYQNNRPTVLIASPYVPFPLAHGGAVRMYNLMRRAAQDFDQVLVAFAGESLEAPPELLQLCREVVLVKRPGTHLLPSTARPDAVEEFDSPAFHAALKQTIRKWKPTIAQLEFTQMAQYAGDCAPAKTVLVEHDVTFDLYRQLLAQGEDWELRHQLQRWVPFETAAWRQVDRVVVMSEADRNLALSYGLPETKPVCLANGVDLDRFRPAAHPPEQRRLLFIGSFAHLPNVLALVFFLSEVWPRIKPLGPVLHVIAGSRHEYFLDRYRDRVQLDLGQPGIEVEDFVADVRPAYERAAIVIAPLVASAGTNIKIMEAMAMGKAVVSTPAGINGLNLDPGRDVMVTPTAEDMAEAITRLLEDTAWRESLEREARSTVERDFNWDKIAERQKQLYDELSAQPSLAAKAT